MFLSYQVPHSMAPTKREEKAICHQKRSDQSVHYQHSLSSLECAPHIPRNLKNSQWRRWKHQMRILLTGSRKLTKGTRMHSRLFKYDCSENIINMMICQRSSIYSSSMYISAISKPCRGTGQQFTAVGLSISSFYPAYSNGHLSKQWVRRGSSV